MNLPLDWCLSNGCDIREQYGRRVCVRPTCGIDHGPVKPRELTPAEADAAQIPRTSVCRPTCIACEGDGRGPYGRLCLACGGSGRR